MVALAPEGLRRRGVPRTAIRAARVARLRLTRTRGRRGAASAPCSNRRVRVFWPARRPSPPMSRAVPPGCRTSVVTPATRSMPTTPAHAGRRLGSRSWGKPASNSCSWWKAQEPRESTAARTTEDGPCPSLRADSVSHEAPPRSGASSSTTSFNESPASIPR